MEISPIKLLRRVLAETPRVSSSTRMEIQQLLFRIDMPAAKDQTAEKLLEMLKLGFAAEKLSDEELADWLIKEVWADTEVDSIEHALLSEAINRLQNKE